MSRLKILSTAMSCDVKFIGFQDTSARNEVYQVFAELDVRLSNFIGRRGGDGVELTLTMIRKRQNFMGSYDGYATLSYKKYRSDAEKQHFVSVSSGGGRPMAEERLAYWQKDMQRLVYDNIERCFKDPTHSS